MDTTFIFGCIIGIALIGHFGPRFECAVAMSEPVRDEELLTALCRKRGAHPLPIALRTASQIQGDVEDFTLEDPDQLCLSPRRLLKVQPAQSAAVNRHRLVVLYKFGVNPELLKRCGSVSLHKVAT